MAHYDIFRHHLLSKFPAYGHALWEPNPGNLYPAVEVGDVGYIREGKFRRLFNVLLPANHPSHTNFGVPEYHEPLTPNIGNHIDIGTLNPHDFYSAGVTLGPELERWADGPKEPGEVTFSCPKNQGAVLCLPIEAKREDTVANTRFGKWMIKHIDQWFAWARHLELGVDRMEDIVLVTGTHRTRSCTNVAFPGGQEDAQASFGAMVNHSGDIVAINWQFSRERNRGAVLNCGPSGENLPEDQCIFVRGFRVARKFMILPRLKGAAGPSPDSEEYDEEPDVELIPIPATQKYRDPLHTLLEFIAEETPHCDMVLVHDNDLAQILGILGSEDTSLESLQLDALLSHLRIAKPKIYNISFGLDLPSADITASDAPDIVPVATLSAIFEEELAKSRPQPFRNIFASSSRQQRSPIEPRLPPSKVPAQHMYGTTTVAPKGSNPDGTRAGVGAAGTPRRGIVVSNISSEGETTDSDDDDGDSWASEDISEGAAETAGTSPTDKRPPNKEEIRLREAKVEAQRQRELFVKQPKRSYSNLGRTQSGLLSQLLNPDPTVLPPARPSSTHDMTRPGIPSPLASGKSSAAVPRAAQITAQAPMGAAASSSNSDSKVIGGGGYRPKGRPQGEELEDDSDSPGDPDDTIQLSHSLAQQRLAALANPARRRALDNQVQRPGMGARVATSPIPLDHPRNLPAPAPPTTPRTTRRQMLATELSESLRRNLLWERQVSETNLLDKARRRDGNVLGGAGPSQQQQQQGGSTGAAEDAPAAAADDNVAERRRPALARNRTWDDFHYFGL